MGEGSERNDDAKHEMKHHIIDHLSSPFLGVFGVGTNVLIRFSGTFVHRVKLIVEIVRGTFEKVSMGGLDADLEFLFGGRGFRWRMKAAPGIFAVTKLKGFGRIKHRKEMGDLDCLRRACSGEIRRLFVSFLFATIKVDGHDVQCAKDPSVELGVVLGLVVALFGSLYGLESRQEKSRVGVGFRLGERGCR